MSKIHVCDVPGCDGARRKWQRLCVRCYAGLPGDIRNGILTAHRQRLRAEKKRQLKRAASHLGLTPADAAVLPHPSRISGERAFELNQRLMGER